jgi:hypothetical protein
MWGRDGGECYLSDLGFLGQSGSDLDWLMLHERSWTLPAAHLVLGMISNPPRPSIAGGPEGSFAHYMILRPRSGVHLCGRETSPCGSFCWRSSRIVFFLVVTAMWYGVVAAVRWWVSHGGSLLDGVVCFLCDLLPPSHWKCRWKSVPPSQTRFPDDTFNGTEGVKVIVSWCDNITWPLIND